jgi:hypothetical protein
MINPVIVIRILIQLKLIYMVKKCWWFHVMSSILSFYNIFQHIPVLVKIRQWLPLYMKTYMCFSVWKWSGGESLRPPSLSVEFLATQVILTSLVPFTYVRFWQTRQNCCAMHTFHNLLLWCFQFSTELICN